MWIKSPPLVAALAIATASSAFAADGSVSATASYWGALVGDRVVIEAACHATAQGDGDDYPDPLSLQMSCVVTQGGRTIDVPRLADATNGNVVPAAAAAGTYSLDVEPFSVCVTAEATFADGSRVTRSHCKAASETDLLALR